MKSNHPLLEQFFDLYASIKKEAEAEIRRRGEVDFSYLLTDTDEEYYDERPCICVTDRHDITTWDIVEKVYWHEETDRFIMVLQESGELPMCYCDAMSIVAIYRDVLLTD